MKKFYEEIEAEFITYEAEDVVLASATPTIDSGENYIGGNTGIGNID